MKYPAVLSLLVSALTVAGCGGKSDTDNAVPPPTSAPNNAQVGTQSPVNPEVTPPPSSATVSAPPPAPVVPPPGTGDASSSASSGPGLLEGAPKDAVPDLINLNNAFQAFRSVEMRSPRTLNELLSSGQIKSLPQPPAGMRYYIDERNLRIILVKE